MNFGRNEFLQQIAFVQISQTNMVDFGGGFFNFGEPSNFFEIDIYYRDPRNPSDLHRSQKTLSAAEYASWEASLAQEARQGRYYQIGGTWLNLAQIATADHDGNGLLLYFGKDRFTLRCRNAAEATELAADINSQLANNKPWPPKNYNLPNDGDKPAAPAYTLPRRRTPGMLEAMRGFGSDLVDEAEKGHFNPLIGRKAQMDQLLTVLLQSQRRNAVLLGDPGVGKTALVEGLAQLIANPETRAQLPEELQRMEIYTLNIGAMTAGTKYRGEFEQKLTTMLEKIQKANEGGANVVLFIDELHAVMNAGGAEGASGAGQLLKPYLTKPWFRVIGATTEDEYAKYVKEDGAFERRFAAITLDSPSLSETAEIIDRLRSRFEQKQNLKIDAKLAADLVEMSYRFLPTRPQPDTAISILDNATARAKKAGDKALSRDHVLAAISTAAHLPQSFLDMDDHSRVQNLEAKLGQRVLAQDEAIAEVSEIIRVGYAGLIDAKRPRGVFMAIGPTGVGKTETGRALAETLTGTEDNLIRIDMSKYQEEHSVAGLLGSQPGYVGYGEEGELIKAIRRHPNAVIVLDELEKAHPKVLDILLPLFDEGEITDFRGRKVSARNNVFILTSNAGASAVQQLVNKVVQDQPIGFRGAERTVQTHQNLDKKVEAAYRAALAATFRPEFLGRLDGVVFYKPLTPDLLAQIAAREVRDLNKNLQRNYGLQISLSDAAMAKLSATAFDPSLGARAMKQVFKKQITAPLTLWLMGDKQQRAGMTDFTISDIGANFAIAATQPAQKPVNDNKKQPRKPRRPKSARPAGP